MEAEFARRPQPQRHLDPPLPTSSPLIFFTVVDDPHILMFPCSLLALLLILLTALTASAGTPRATKCKVQKRQQGLFHISPTPTSPATDLPTLASSDTPSSTPTILPPFDYSKAKVRGVNLGGWFMMEVSVR
jgi:hypothetical protein